MSPTSFLISDRAVFQDAWREALVEAGLDPRQVHPDALASSLRPGHVFIVDAAAAAYADEDELLSTVGLARALHAVIAVALPASHSLHAIEDLLEDLSAGLIVRSPADVRRVAQALARRSDAQRSKRFEYITVSPRPGELLAVFGDGSAQLIARPVGAEDDGSDVAGISLASDAMAATLQLSSGREITLHATSYGTNGKAHSAAPSPSVDGAIAIDGAKLGARLRELRLAAGLTQAELARRTGIHRPNIARVEAGRHTPSLETLARLASAIGVSTTVVLREA